MAQATKTNTVMWEQVPIPEQVPVTEGMVNVDPNMDLYYWDTGGDGEPIIMLHAATGSANFWGYQQPVFAKAGYRVIAYSRRGYAGSSPTNKELPGVASEDMAKVLDHLGIEKAHVIAAAHGGSFAMDFAVTYPERVQSFLLLSSTLSLKEDNWSEINNRVRPRDAFNPLPSDMKELSPSYRAGDPEGLANWVALRKAAFPGGRKAWVWPQYTAKMTWDHVTQYKGPLMIVTGDADTYLPPSQMRMQASYFPQSEPYIISESAHAANWEQPHVFNELALDFFKRNAMD
jgi:pimeloyl-ACP methyl ester carboxylesterase